MLLSKQYTQDKAALLEEMRMAPTPQEILGAVDAYLTKITDLNGKYIQGLTRPQARVALSIIGVQKEQFRMLADQIDLLSQSVLEQTNQACSPRDSVATVNKTIPKDTLAGIGVSTFVAAFLTNPFMAIPAASLAGLLAVTALHRASYLASSSTRSEIPGHNNDLGYDYDILLATLEHIFKAVDNAIEELGASGKTVVPQPASPGLERHSRLLEFFQDLLGWYHRKKGGLPDEILSALQTRIGEQIPDLLSEYRIQVYDYSTKEGGRNPQIFDFEDEVGEPRLSTPLMVRPALLKDDEVLCRGRVIEPLSSNRKSTSH